MHWSTVTKTAGAVGIFAIVHSALASLSAKRTARSLAGERTADGLYRFVFNGFSVLTFAGLVRFIWPLPDRRLYRIGGIPSVLLRAGQLATVGAMIQTNRMNGFGQVTGIKHAREFVDGKPISTTPVAQHPTPDGECLDGWRGMFRLSSHPNNYLVLFLYWLSPVMTLKWASVGLVTSIYMVLGSIHEDRRLLAAYGDRYRCYRARVPHWGFHSLARWRAALRRDA